MRVRDLGLAGVVLGFLVVAVLIVYGIKGLSEKAAVPPPDVTYRELRAEPEGVRTR